MPNKRIAENPTSGIPTGVVHLITKVNAVACMLFHVEHLPPRQWFYRWRILGDYPPAYLAWRSGTSAESRVIIQPEISRSQIEAEWRSREDQPWCKATLQEVAAGQAFFRLTAKEDFHSDTSFRAVAEVQGMVCCYIFPPLTLHAGIETTLPAKADGPFPDNILLHPGEFVAEDDAILIENTDPSVGFLVSPTEPNGRLSAIVGCAERRLFAVKRGAKPATTEAPPWIQ